MNNWFDPWYKQAWSWGGVVVAVCIVFAMIAIHPTDPQRAQETLTAFGFTDARIGDYSWFTCGDDYWSSTAFTAKAPSGVTVSGAVCCGIWKGCSVKL